MAKREVRKLALVSAIGIVVALVVLVGARALAAPDPLALKMQGPDTFGNAVPMLALPIGASGLTQTFLSSTANAANATNTATLAGSAGVTTYLSGFTCSASGSTAVLTVTVTVAGTSGGSMTYSFVFPAGANTLAATLSVQFPLPIPASGTNTSITVTLPAGGAGNATANVVAYGFRQ